MDPQAFGFEFSIFGTAFFSKQQLDPVKFKLHRSRIWVNLHVSAKNLIKIRGGETLNLCKSGSKGAVKTFLLAFHFLFSD
jgi:hypothetical protein